MRSQSPGLDISNTFKITGIALPTGYSYNSDAQGFLSEFTLAPVPEPETYVLMLAGLGLLAAAIQQALDFTAQGSLLAFDDCGVVINHAMSKASCTQLWCKAQVRYSAST